MTKDLETGPGHAMPEPNAGDDVLGVAEAILDIVSMYLTYLLTAWIVLPILGVELQPGGYVTFAVTLMWMSLSRKFWLDMLFRRLSRKKGQREAGPSG
jgi:hypothetical protein